MTKFTFEPPKITTKWKIGDKYYGLVYYTISANFLQRFLSFRLKPVEVLFESVHRQKLGGRISISIKVFSFRVSFGLEI